MKSKRLIFVRHAKAELQSPDITDFERSLTSAGKSHSKQMARILKSKVKDLGLIVTSPAFRAYETAMIFCNEYGIAHDKAMITPDLYFSTENFDLLSFIKSHGKDHDTITFFGHNPLISEMAGSYASDGMENLPKTGIASVIFNTSSWSAALSGKGKTEFFLKPKSLL